MKRRHFTKMSLLGSAGLMLPGTLVPSDHFPDKKGIPKTDTHVHLFDRENISYPWLKNAKAIDRDFLLSDFDLASEGSNVTKILFMESGSGPGYAVPEAKWVTELASKDKRIQGILAQFDVSKGEGGTEELENLSRFPLLRGVRGGFPEGASQSKGFLEGMKMLQNKGLTFDLNTSTPKLSEGAITAQKCPNNIFILDHFGNPDIKDIEEWKKGIALLAERDNVNCKVSGIITKFGKDWSLDTIRPFFDHVLEHFGPRRLVYGGDWPVVLLAGSYRSWASAFESLTMDLSKNEKQNIFHKNADRIYHI